MSEQLVKHSRKAYNTWSNKNHSWQKKLREFFIELLIIVFAVSLSFFIERWREKEQERQQVKELLSGLKDDLQADTKELTSDSLGYEGKKKGIDYFLYIRKPIDTATFKRNFSRISQNIALIPNVSRFESLKSFGRMTAIKNKKLVNDIFELYEEKIPGLINATKAYNEILSRMLGFIDENLTYTDDLFDISHNNIVELLEKDFLKNLLRKKGYINEILFRYGAVSNLTRTLIEEIAEELKH